MSTCMCVCRQRRAEEDTQQSSHKEQVNALWQRLEDAATAHKEEVQQLKQQLQDAGNTHEEEERELQQMAADAATAHKQEVQDLQQQLEAASVAHRHQVENLQQQHDQEVVSEGKQHKAALSQVRFGKGKGCTGAHWTHSLLTNTTMLWCLIVKQLGVNKDCSEPQTLGIDLEDCEDGSAVGPFAAICLPSNQLLQFACHLTAFCVGQVQKQLEAQQAQHAVELQDLSSRADEMESRLQQATDLDRLHVTQLTASEADLDELRQVGSDQNLVQRSWRSCPDHD